MSSRSDGSVFSMVKVSVRDGISKILLSSLSINRTGKVPVATVLCQLRTLKNVLGAGLLARGIDQRISWMTRMGQSFQKRRRNQFLKKRVKSTFAVKKLC